MSGYLDEIEARMAAVLCDGRGADGTLGTDAQGRAIPAGRFRWTRDGVSQRDPAIPDAERDHALSFDWTSAADSPDDSNEIDGDAIRHVRLELLVAYVEGPALAQLAFPSPGTGETKAAAVANARKRALSDAERIRRALCFPSLFGGGTAPEIIGCSREGASTIERLTSGVLLCATTYLLILAVPMGSDFDP